MYQTEIYCYYQLPLILVFQIFGLHDKPLSGTSKRVISSENPKSQMIHYLVRESIKLLNFVITPFTIANFSFTGSKRK